MRAPIWREYIRTWLAPERLFAQSQLGGDARGGGGRNGQLGFGIRHMVNFAWVEGAQAFDAHEPLEHEENIQCGSALQADE